MKTFSAKAHEVKREWFIIDASNQVLGRLATKVANTLRGKLKPEYTPHVDTGDYVVVINADKIKVTGKKKSDKMYYRYTGYIGNLKSTNLEKMQEKTPERVIELAVKRMIPRNALGREVFKKLKVYAGENHPHTAQQPKKL